jgi:glucoamylase
VAITTVLALATGGAASAADRAAPADVAPGAPGAPSYFDLARKDCVGTATGTRSKVWYTVAGGALSDVYEPTIDNTNVSTLQYLVTDGSTFTDLQTRDMTYTVAADPTGMACTVTATNTHHGYRLSTTYITDPARDTVLMRAPGSRRCPGPAPTWLACTCTHGSTRTSTATAAAAPRTRAQTPA